MRSVFLISLLWPVVCEADLNVTPIEMSAIVQACAIGGSLNIEANIEGSLNEIFEQGADTNGRLKIENEADFLSLFPDDAKQEAYSLYVSCITPLIIGTNVSVDPQDQIKDDIFLACRMRDSIETSVPWGDDRLRDRLPVESIFEVPEFMTDGFGRMFVGHSGSLYYSAIDGTFGGVYKEPTVRDEMMVEMANYGMIIPSISLTDFAKVQFSEQELDPQLANQGLVGGLDIGVAYLVDLSGVFSAHVGFRMHDATGATIELYMISEIADCNAV